MIKAVGARVLNLSPYSPDFNPIELWWSQLKSFLRQFSPTTTNMVDVLLDADNEYAMIDATIVRAHQHSAGAKGGSQLKKRLDAAKVD